MRSGAVHFLLFLPLLAGASPQNLPLPERIDAEVARIPGFNRATVAPACDDGEYLRRVMLDLVGYPPSAEETRAFVADATPDKRATVVEKLLTSDRFGDFWSRRWMDVFFGNVRAIREEPLGRLDPEERERLFERFRRWLAGRIQRDWAWTDTVRDLLIAEGVPDTAPALAYKLALDGWPRRPYFEGRAVSHFMGVDFSCAGCHDHPFDRWTFDDNYALGAFSNGRKIRWGDRGAEVIEGPEPAGRPIPGDKGFFRFHATDQRIYPPVFPRIGKPADGEVLARAFARLMVSRENVQFRVAFVNRVWAWLLGRGIVSPVDDFNLKNKPLSQGLLRLLAEEFAANGHSLRFLLRTLCATQTYQRRCDGQGSMTRETFARGRIRLLSPEQLMHSLEVATLGSPRFDPERALRLAERMSRSERQACASREAVPDVRALSWLADSDEVWSMIREGAVVKELAAPPVGPELRVKSMFLAALSREPGPRELERYATFLKGRGEAGIHEAYWTLLNSTEFLTRH